MRQERKREPVDWLFMLRRRGRGTREEERACGWVVYAKKKRRRDKRGRESLWMGCLC